MSKKSKAGLIQKKLSSKSQTESGQSFDNKARPIRPIIKQSFFALIVFVLFFCCLELILALFGIKPLILTEDPMIGFATNSPLFVEQLNNDGTTILRTADNKQLHFNYQEFPKDKGQNTYRIFSLGASTTYGHPFTDKASFSRWLDSFLKAAAPDRNWEVINTGGISYASYRIANLMRELVNYKPDLFIIYSGQNEFLEERSYGSITKLPTWIINSDSALCNTRVYSSMKRLLQKLRTESALEARKRFEVSGEVDDILTHSTGPTSYQRDDVLREQILHHYQLNIERMVKIAHDVDAEVIFVKPAVNLRNMSPFKSEHKKGLTAEEINLWDDFYTKAKKFDSAKKYSEAIDLYYKALAIDDRYAKLHYRIGRILFKQGRFEESEKFFWRAVDEDIAPLRMVREIQDILSVVAQKFDIPLIDFQKILRDQTLKKYGHGVLGKEFFLDHVHTNEHGYRLLALALLEQLNKQGVIESLLPPEKFEEVQTQFISSLNEEDYRVSFIHLGLVFDWAGKFDEAKNILFKSLDSYGDQPEVFELLGKIYAREGDATESMHYFQKALDAGYETAALHAALGNFNLQQQNDPVASMKSYQNSLRINYNSPSVHVQLGYTYVLLEEFKLPVFITMKPYGYNPISYLPMLTLWLYCLSRSEMPRL